MQKKRSSYEVGQSLGVVSLGKNIVLVEGNESSLDKMLHGSIIENKFPDITLVPSEGVDTLKSFSRIQEEVLSKTIWGVKFSMLCDGDASILTEKTELENLKFLPRYHVENYFLDENIIAEIFKDMEDEGSWLRDPVKIREEIKEIAKGKLTYAISLNISNYFRMASGNIDLMLKDCDAIGNDEIESKVIEKTNLEIARINDALKSDEIKNKINELKNRFDESFENDTDFWIKNIPGKVVLSIFCSKAKIQDGRFKKLYIANVVENNLDTFNEVEDIFKAFSEL